jgi:serine/threonine-protein kinase
VVGQTIDGRYRVLSVLGVGGMGAVYEAEHTGTGQRVAVKVVHAEISGKADVVGRFHREARAASSIQTPHIVRVLDSGTDPVTHVSYMVMELLHGEDLRSLLQRVGKLPPDLALRLIGQACLGIGKAHEAGVIHRDIKPANLFLSRGEGDEITVKVVDFGIAKMVDAQLPGAGALTRTGGVVGSPLYMSPEQAMGHKTLDLRTDVWSLGVVLYEALAGRTPQLEGETFMAIMMAILSRPAPPIAELAPWVSPEIAAIVHRMIASEPDARFASMAAVLEAIVPSLPAGLSVRVADLAALGGAEQAAQAPWSALGDDATKLSVAPPSVGFEPTQPSYPPARLATMEGPDSAASTIEAPASGASTIAAPASVRSSMGNPAPATAVTRIEVEPTVSQATMLSPQPRASRLAPAVLVPLALGLAGLLAYRLGVQPAPSALGAAPTASAVAASAPGPSAAPALPLPELVVRLAVEPEGAVVEVDGRVTPVSEGGVELRGPLGSAHHVRLVKGAQKVEGEVAITSQGAVPPRMALSASVAETPAPKGAVASAPSSGKPGASAVPASTGVRNAGKHPALDGKFE